MFLSPPIITSEKPYLPPRPCDGVIDAGVTPPPQLRRHHHRGRSHTSAPAAVRATATTDAAGNEEDNAFTKYSGYLFKGAASEEIGRLESYDISAIVAIYGRRPFLVLRLSLQIGSSLGRWFALRYLDRLGERADEMFELGLRS